MRDIGFMFEKFVTINCATFYTSSKISSFLFLILYSGSQYEYTYRLNYISFHQRTILCQHRRLDVLQYGDLTYSCKVLMCRSHFSLLNECNQKVKHKDAPQREQCYLNNLFCPRPIHQLLLLLRSSAFLLQIQKNDKNIICQPIKDI